MFLHNFVSAWFKNLTMVINFSRFPS